MPVHNLSLHKTTRQSGFTLIEIIIALVVIAVALGAVIATTGNSVKHGAHIKEKTIALWLAQNISAEVNIKKQWLPAGNQFSDEEMAGQQWQVKRIITQTPDKNIKKMEIQVYSGRTTDNKIVSLTTYFVKPQEN